MKATKSQFPFPVIYDDSKNLISINYFPVVLVIMQEKRFPTFKSEANSQTMMIQKKVVQ